MVVSLPYGYSLQSGQLTSLVVFCRDGSLYTNVFMAQVCVTSSYLHQGVQGY
jgi:hypothetical protein